MLVALTSPNTFFSSPDILNSAFSALNTHQIKQILTNITPDEFSKPVTNELKQFTQRYDCIALLSSSSSSSRGMLLNTTIFVADCWHSHQTGNQCN